jgi:hypothetical protein
MRRIPALARSTGSAGRAAIPETSVAAGGGAFRRARRLSPATPSIRTGM